MKIGNIDGSPEEIKNFLVDNGLCAKDILEVKEKTHIKWLIIPLALFISFSFILWMVNNPPVAIYGILIIFEFLSILWLTVSIHLRFENLAVSLFSLLILLTIFSVCLGIINIKEAIDTIQGKISTKTS